MKKIRKNKYINIILITIFMCLLYYNIFARCTYEVFLNNKSIGKVVSKKEFFTIEKELKEEINNRFFKVSGEDKITFKKVWDIDNLSSKEEIRDNFFTNSNVIVETLGIFCNNDCLAFIDNEEQYKNVIDNVEKKYKDTLRLKKITDFKVSNLSLKKCTVALKNVCVEKQYINSQAINSILKNTKFLKVDFIAEVEEKKEVKPSTVVKASKELLIGQRKVKEQGETGIKSVCTKLIVRNGRIVKKNIVEEKVVKNSKDKVILVGRKNPEVLGTSYFTKPSRGTISSGFGRRWGRMHNGVDIAAPIGTAIYAAYDGIVSFSGWQDGYGKIIIIKHENGYETRYGHCSELLASEGQKIRERELIAKVGNTGKSTGPHVHFEVRKNNIPQDPIKYLK